MPIGSLRRHCSTDVGLKPPHLPCGCVGKGSEPPRQPVAQRHSAHAAGPEVAGEPGYGGRHAHAQAAGGRVRVALWGLQRKHWAWGELARPEGSTPGFTDQWRTTCCPTRPDRPSALGLRMLLRQR
jgi:hypothetical protein